MFCHQHSGSPVGTAGLAGTVRTLTGREWEVLVHGLAALPEHLTTVGRPQQFNQTHVRVILVGGLLHLWHVTDIKCGHLSQQGPRID